MAYDHMTVLILVRFILNKNRGRVKHPVDGLGAPLPKRRGGGSNARRKSW